MLLYPLLVSVFSYSLMSRLAVVCGGSRGIGKAVSLLLAERGCRLAVVSRNEDAARATVASLHGGTTVPYLWRLFIEALLILLQQCKKMLQKTFYSLTGFKFSIFPENLMLSGCPV